MRGRDRRRNIATSVVIVLVTIDDLCLACRDVGTCTDGSPGEQAAPRDGRSACANRAAAQCLFANVVTTGRKPCCDCKCETEFINSHESLPLCLSFTLSTCDGPYCSTPCANILRAAQKMTDSKSRGHACCPSTERVWFKGGKNNERTADPFVDHISAQGKATAALRALSAVPCRS